MADAATNDPKSWFDAFVEETTSFDSTFAPPPAVGDPADQLRALNCAAFRRGRSALCLSGGGIRSASFAVGVLQTLAQHHVLQQFDYLSTVSGGGFAGSWLSGWLYRTKSETLDETDREAAKSGFQQLVSGIGPAGDVEPWPVSRLREYTRYLSPHAGVLSADFWTLIATMIRNLVLNWFVLVPLLAAALLVPRIHYALIEHYSVVQHSMLHPNEPQQLVPIETARARLQLADATITVIYAGLFLLSVGFTAANLPSFGRRRATEKQVLLAGVVPLCVGTLFLLFSWVFEQETPHVLQSAAYAALLDMTAWAVAAMLWSKQRFRPRTWIAAALAGATIGLGMAAIGAHFFPAGTELHKMYVTFAFPLDLLAAALGIVVFVGFAGGELKPADLEWNSRFVAWLLVAAGGWFVVSVVVFGGPWLIHRVQQSLPSVVHALGGITAVTGGVAAWLSRPSGENVEPVGARKIAAALAMPTFALLMLVSVAWANERIVSDWSRFLARVPMIDVRLCQPDEENNNIRRECRPADAGLAEAMLLMALLLGIGFVMNRFVPVNKFSLNAMYRHRLTRAYLGASRKTRHPNPFTGFDSDDDVELCRLTGQQPLHVVNMTLNTQRDQQLGRQDRQAESFTMTPVHVGCRSLGYRPAAEYGRDRWNERALTLGNAMSISGAAASPAMGSFSTPTRSFLLTLLNARLGLWMGNPGPAGADTWQRSDPKAGVGPILREMLGLTTDQNPYVYLSDGGHFDNLGLWEMIQRRCKYIVVVDGGCDPAYGFGDLANAVRQARIDHGVDIDIDTSSISLAAQRHGNAHFAIGTITYHDDDVASDGPTIGRLVYVKPALSGDEPVDVLNYSTEHPTFPHEPTSNQFFTEAQFESYRMLGVHSAMHLLAGRAATIRALCEGESAATV